MKTQEHINKMLLIVDPQVDFVTGSLPVPGAAPAMRELAQWLHGHAADYVHIVVTCDWHPRNHSSFAPQGGPWPVHCVQHTVGAAIVEPLAAELVATAAPVTVLVKGTQAPTEEYSIFKADDSAAMIDAIVDLKQVAQVDICGLAGDVCVLNTLRDGRARYGSVPFAVLQQFAPSLDGGKALAAEL